MPQLNAYLSFDGTCAEAMRFYERTLGAKLEMLMTNRESPIADQMPPGNEDRVIHARLVHADFVLMAGDAMVGQPYEAMKGITLTLSYPTVAEARRVFDGLSAGGTVTMPMQESFWADAFGMLVDRYGTPWIVNGALKEGYATRR
jgi:PhnB protein